MLRVRDLVRVFVLGAGVSLLCVPGVGEAQGGPGGAPPSAAEMEAQMQQMMGAMGQMTQNMMESTMAVLEKPETARRLAAFTKNYYDALVVRGFDKDDALKIVMSVGVPSISGAP